MEKVLERFLRYVSIDTHSDENANSFPSTQSQIEFAKILVEELRQIGLSDVLLDNFGYVYATLPANTDYPARTIGFISHMDTSPDYNGKNISPQIHKNYNGQVIELKNSVKLTPEEFPELLLYKNQTLITSDGTTLLGADDKAGIAEIITAMEFLIQHPEIKHDTIKIAFTPDEEIGKGAKNFDVKRFNAEFAYTVDGGQIGELEYENFNAAMAKISIRGKSVHPGSAKNKMINAAVVATQFEHMLPANEKPEHTENREGFYHLLDIQANVEYAQMKYIIRDHDQDLFEKRKKELQEICAALNLKYKGEIVKIDVNDQYYNMRDVVSKKPEIIELASKAYIEEGITPIIKPIRGGTDGSQLSFKGLPCPNIFAGGHNFHGPYEFIPLESMIKASKVIVNICRIAAID